MIFLSNGSYSHVKSSKCPIPLKDHRRFTFWTQKMKLWCWDGFPFQSSDFQFPMFLFWLDHSNIFGAHLVKGEIFQCIPKLWWFIPKDSLKEERSFFQNKFWNGRFPCEFDARVANLPPWISPKLSGNLFFLAVELSSRRWWSLWREICRCPAVQTLGVDEEDFWGVCWIYPPPTQEASGK